MIARGQPPTDPLGRFVLWLHTPVVGWSGPTWSVVVSAVGVVLALIMWWVAVRGERR